MLKAEKRRTPEPCLVVKNKNLLKASARGLEKVAIKDDMDKQQSLTFASLSRLQHHEATQTGRNPPVSRSYFYFELLENRKH